MIVSDILAELKRLSSTDHYAKLSHFGINNHRAYGVKVPLIRNLAKIIGKNHDLALELWETEVHEARILASMIADPKLLTERLLNQWVNDFDSWDICDQTCTLIIKTSFANQKIYEFALSNDEYVKRTAFTLMCGIAVHDKNASNDSFLPYLLLIEREAWDERNFVKKAVNWALRQIGKRNEELRVIAIDTSVRILNQNTKSAQWIARDALRELNDSKIIARISKK